MPRLVDTHRQQHNRPERDVDRRIVERLRFGRLFPPAPGGVDRQVISAACSDKSYRVAAPSGALAQSFPRNCTRAAAPRGRKYGCGRLKTRSACGRRSLQFSLGMACVGLCLPHARRALEYSGKRDVKRIRTGGRRRQVDLPSPDKHGSLRFEGRARVGMGLCSGRGKGQGIKRRRVRGLNAGALSCDADRPQRCTGASSKLNPIVRQW